MAELVWLIIAVVLFIVEAVTYGLVCIWFALGAIVTMIAVFCGVDNFILQMAIFFVSSAIFLLFTRNFFKKYLYRKAEKTNADSVVGTKGIVTEAIDNINGTGAVKTAGKVWTARSKTGDKIALDAQVNILEIQGVKLIVEQALDEQSPA